MYIHVALRKNVHSPSQGKLTLFCRCSINSGIHARIFTALQLSYLRSKMHHYSPWDPFTFPSSHTIYKLTLPIRQVTTSPNVFLCLSDFSARQPAIKHWCLVCISGRFNEKNNKYPLNKQVTSCTSVLLQSNFRDVFHNPSVPLTASFGRNSRASGCSVWIQKHNKTGINFNVL